MSHVVRVSRTSYVQPAATTPTGGSRCCATAIPLHNLTDAFSWFVREGRNLLRPPFRTVISPAPLAPVGHSKLCPSRGRAQPSGGAQLVAPAIPHRNLTGAPRARATSGKRHSCRFTGTTGVSPVAAARGSQSFVFGKQPEQLQKQLSFGARANSPVPKDYPFPHSLSRVKRASSAFTSSALCAPLGYSMA